MLSLKCLNQDINKSHEGPSRVSNESSSSAESSSEEEEEEEDDDKNSHHSEEDTYIELPARTIPLHHPPSPILENFPNPENPVKDPSTGQALAACRGRGRRRSSLAEVIADWPLLEHTERRPEYRLSESMHLVHNQRIEVIHGSSIDERTA